MQFLALSYAFPGQILVDFSLLEVHNAPYGPSSFKVFGAVLANNGHVLRIYRHIFSWVFRTSIC